MLLLLPLELAYGRGVQCRSIGVPLLPDPAREFAV
jgi:hypothetical protein